MHSIGLFTLLIIHQATSALGAAEEPFFHVRSSLVPYRPSNGIDSLQKRSDPLILSSGSAGLVRRSPTGGQDRKRKQSADSSPGPRLASPEGRSRARSNPTQSFSQSPPWGHSGSGSESGSPDHGGSSDRGGSPGRGGSPEPGGSSGRGGSPDGGRSSPQRQSSPAKILLKTSPFSEADVSTGSLVPNLRDVPPEGTHYRSGQHPRKISGAAIAYRDGKSTVLGTGKRVEGFLTAQQSGHGVLQSYGSGGVETKIVLPGEPGRIKAASKSGGRVAVKAKMYGGNSKGEGAYGGVVAMNEEDSSSSSESEPSGRSWDR